MDYYETNDSVSEINSIAITKELIPYRFSLDVELEEKKDIEFLVQYNAEYDFFTMDLYVDSNLLSSGEKLMLGQVLFQDVNIPDFPTIIPWDFSGMSTRVGWDDLGDNIILVVIDDDFLE